MLEPNHLLPINFRARNSQAIPNRLDREGAICSQSPPNRVILLHVRKETNRSMSNNVSNYWIPNSSPLFSVFALVVTNTKTITLVKLVRGFDLMSLTHRHLLAYNRILKLTKEVLEKQLYICFPKKCNILSTRQV